ncbi:hypothetical protein [Okeania sp. KiyG1]|uniref:hypothetical protein n=1 Tax=Okeania sp. KiyG1 TaxID=2720165 RepID=UPI001921F816|nr:hypothetical protein [Okeania sp. KiyG1]
MVILAEGRRKKEEGRGKREEGKILLCLNFKLLTYPNTNYYALMLNLGSTSIIK